MRNGASCRSGGGWGRMANGTLCALMQVGYVPPQAPMEGEAEVVWGVRGVLPEVMETY